MITFENSPVQIEAPAGTFNLLANSSSISISNPRRETKRFGTAGFHSQVLDGPMTAQLSVSYYMTDADSGVRGLFTGDGIQLFNANVGPYRLYSGVASSMSMSIDPYSVVSCTLDIAFYNGYDQGGSTSTITAPGDVIHGGASDVSTDLLWTNDIISVNYSMNQGISPVYPLGGLAPTGYTREGGTISVDLEGTGLGSILDFTGVCEGYTTGNINLTGVCEGTVGGGIPFSGYVTDPSITVAPNEEIVGSLSVAGIL
tara:strand:- start:1811 stop:2581 length:771 start_codon:yes stop_codon:yes gene_type:complete